MRVRNKENRNRAQVTSSKQERTKEQMRSSVCGLLFPLQLICVGGCCSLGNRKEPCLQLVGHYSVWHAQVISFMVALTVKQIWFASSHALLSSCPRPRVTCQPGMTAEAGQTSRGRLASLSRPTRRRIGCRRIYCRGLFDSTLHVRSPFVALRRGAASFPVRGGGGFRQRLKYALAFYCLAS